MQPFMPGATTGAASAARVLGRRLASGSIDSGTDSSSEWLDEGYSAFVGGLYSLFSGNIFCGSLRFQAKHHYDITP